MINVNLLLKEMLDQQASDIHLKVGSPPYWRINGQLVNFGDDRLTVDQLETLARSLMNDAQWEKYERIKEMDFAKDFDSWRLRVNVAKERGHTALVMRIIPQAIPDFTTLHLPDVLKEIALEQQGLILVTGETGSGKSTTVASMIQHINETAAWNIVTIEDPIEYTFKDQKSCIMQREVGVDTDSFANAVRAALRQDPDLIVVGEMRDKETILAVLHAAETGHMVISTLHTIDATQTIDRLVDVFPGDQQTQVRGMLGSTMSAAVCLRLMRTSAGTGRVPAVEVMRATPTIRSLIREQKIKEIRSAMTSSGAQYGMQTFDQSLLSLFREGLITMEAALNESSSPNDLKLAMDGIGGASAKGVTLTK